MTPGETKHSSAPGSNGKAELLSFYRLFLSTVDFSFSVCSFPKCRFWYEADRHQLRMVWSPWSIIQWICLQQRAPTLRDHFFPCTLRVIFFFIHFLGRENKSNSLHAHIHIMLPGGLDSDGSKNMEDGEQPIHYRIIQRWCIDRRVREAYSVLGEATGGLWSMIASLWFLL